MIKKIKQFILRIWSKYGKAIIIFIIIFLVSNFLSISGGCMFTRGDLRRNNKRIREINEYILGELDAEIKRNSEYEKRFGDIDYISEEYRRIREEVTNIRREIVEGRTELGELRRKIQESNNRLEAELRRIEEINIRDKETIHRTNELIQELKKYLPKKNIESDRH